MPLTASNFPVGCQATASTVQPPAAPLMSRAGSPLLTDQSQTSSPRKPPLQSRLESGEKANAVIGARGPARKRRRLPVRASQSFMPSPLLPNEPVTTLTAITPYKVWLALLAVCTLSYASYLLQRFLAPSDSDLAIAFLGGLYSSTATTVVLSRNAGAQPATSALAQAGIMLATSVMSSERAVYFHVWRKFSEI